MLTRPIVALTALAAVVLPLASGAPVCAANGGKSKRVVYREFVPAGAGPGQGFEFHADLEPLLFRLVTVRDKYRVVRIRIRNTGDRPLALSATGDRMEVQFRGAPPQGGILDLAAHDAAVWDGLPADLRSAIVYPRVVERGEEESIFVFVPGAEGADAPQGFRYTIASVPGRTVVIREVTAATAP